MTFSKSALRLLLSAFIIFHVASIFILPNPEGMLFKYTAGYVATYGNFIGVNTTWRFFSPNPMIKYMQYTVFFKDKDGQPDSKDYRYPPHYSEEKYFENFSRKLNHAMYMMSHPDFMRENFKKVMCAWHPEADEIAVSARGRVIPSIEKSKLFSGDRSELGEVQTQAVTEFKCKTESEE